MSKYKTYLIYLIMSITIFIVLPSMLEVNISNFQSKSNAILLLVVINPLFCFISNLMISIKGKIKFYLIIINSLVFFVSINLFYNNSALFYLVVYFVISIFSLSIGLLIKKALSKFEIKQ